MSNYFFKGGRADPRYASLRLDLCSGRSRKSFRPQSSAAYCKMHLYAILLGDGRHDVYDVQFNPFLECDGERLVSVRQRQPGCFLCGPDRRRSSSMCAGRTRPEMAALRLRGTPG